MNNEDRKSFLRWLETACGGELEKTLVRLEAVLPSLKEQGTRTDASWMIAKIKEELSVRWELDNGQ